MVDAWTPLKAGDQVAIVNACMQDSQAQYHAQAYKKLFDEFGYKLSGLEQLTEQKGERLWAGNVEKRALEVVDALMNEENKAIFLLVGGDGANEVMKLVADAHLSEKSESRSGLLSRGIPVIGLSNNTTLLNPLAQMGIISPIQGKLDAAIPQRLFSEEELQTGDAAEQARKKQHNKIWSDPNSEQRKNVAKNAEALQNLLSGQAKELTFPVSALNEAAKKYKGEKEPVEIIGGCNFHVIESARTPFEVSTAGKYLVVEGPQEQCSVADTLSGLEREGMLKDVRGIFFGYVHGGINDEIKAQVQKYDIPIFSGLPWGHIPIGSQIDQYIPLHTNAVFTNDNGEAKLKIDAVRTKENLQEAYVKPLPAPKISLPVKENSDNQIITSMKSMLEDAQAPNLQGKDVVLAVFPKFGDPIQNMMDAAQGLAAMLHKGSLTGIKSLTLDMSGLYELSPQRSSVYSNIEGKELSPPHKYNDGKMKEKVPDEKSFMQEMKGFLQDFSRTHLNNIPVDVGRDKIVEEISKKSGIKIEDLKDKYREQDARARVDTNKLTQDYQNNNLRRPDPRIVGEHTARAVSGSKNSNIQQEKI